MLSLFFGPNFEQRRDRCSVICNKRQASCDRFLQASGVFLSEEVSVFPFHRIANYYGSIAPAQTIGDTADHLNSRGYSSAKAWRQFAEFIESLDPTLRDEINAVVKERDRVVFNTLSRTFVEVAIKDLNSSAARVLLIFQSRPESAI